MVGAPSSNRCDTCKRRKVKCDEAWPRCGPCSKGRRSCPGPPKRRIRFVGDETAQYLLPIRGVDQQPRDNSPQPSDYARDTHMITLRSTAKDGGMFQKIRLYNFGENHSSTKEVEGIPTMSMSPSSSANELLARRLHSFIDSSIHGTSTSVYIHGMWLKELPRRFGSSDALDNAVSCLVSSHESVVRGNEHSAWLDWGQYGKALKALQAVIDDPKEQFSTNTLAAIAVMWRIEGIFAAASGTVGKQQVHARALAYMLKARGLPNYSDRLEFLLTVDCQVAAVQACIAGDFPEHCMFDSAEWDLAFQHPYGRSELSMLYWRVFREFVRWPGLVHDILMLYLKPDNAPATVENIAQRALTSAQNLEKISHDIDIALADSRICVTKPSSNADPLVPVVFEFRDPEAAPVVGYHSFYTIVVNRMVIHLSNLLSGEVDRDPLFQEQQPAKVTQDLPTTFPISAEYNIPSSIFTGSSPGRLPLSASMIDIIRLRNVQLAQKIWMIYEQARAWKPVGCLFFLNALKSSYPWAGSLEMKAWILNAAADIEDLLPNRTEWDPNKLEMMGGAMSGEVFAMNEQL